MIENHYYLHKYIYWENQPELSIPSDKGSNRPGAQLVISVMSHFLQKKMIVHVSLYLISEQCKSKEHIIYIQFKSVSDPRRELNGCCLKDRMFVIHELL